MKLRTTLFYASALFVAARLAQAPADEMTVYFSPNGGAAAAIVKRIDAAKTTIHVQAYAISEDGITRALIAASKRGVEVRLIVDRHEQGGAGSTSGKIKHAGVPTVVDRAHALMHNKTMVIDDSIVITGSMNFTISGDKKNAENTLIIENPGLAKIFDEDFHKHLAHSSTYTTPDFAGVQPLPTPPAVLPLPTPAHAQEP